MADDATTKAGESTESAEAGTSRVFVSGATGFVGRYVVRELVSRGFLPVCLVRDKSKFVSVFRDLTPGTYEVVVGDVFDDAALAEAVRGCDAAIHLIGIITESPLSGQTFKRIHSEATQRVVDACKLAGVPRYVHMSALGTRSNAISEYHKTKWAAECYVRDSGLAWTIFRPSLIHGPDGEFMRMMRVFVCDAVVPAFGVFPTPFPVIPYFGSGEAKLQPVDVRDVAHCFVAALGKSETIGKTFDMGGAKALSWKVLYRTCKCLIPGSLHWKPLVWVPVFKAKMLARTVMKLPILPKMLRFDVGQVQMSQEDSTCDVRPVEETFGIRMRDFEEELKMYAGEIQSV
ncbi:MAG: NAD(P)H-binding protein [Phycisphaerales bacterium]|nr:NAD(P)H-binding protein [Phycisphaerales bacterium]MCB9855694.1 NAD(P)H-binding protein [Phycisphaerales bacterium]MCB9862589.1 NAD(P)H-binding protein [Phycisphaerales bacterium]